MNNKIDCKLIFCDTVKSEPTPNGVQNSLVGVIQAIEPVNIPGNFTFTVACFLSGIDATKNNVLKARWIDPHSNSTVVFDNVLLPAINQPNSRCGLLNAQINLEFRNIVLSLEGNYTVEVDINDELVAKDSIPVVKKSD